MKTSKREQAYHYKLKMPRYEDLTVKHIDLWTAIAIGTIGTALVLFGILQQMKY